MACSFKGIDYGIHLTLVFMAHRISPKYFMNPKASLDTSNKPHHRTATPKSFLKYFAGPCFPQGKFQLPTPSPWWEMIENTDIFLCFFKTSPRQRFKLIEGEWRIHVHASVNKTIIGSGGAEQATRHRPLTRYVKLRVAHAPGMAGTFSPPPTSKETAS